MKDAEVIDYDELRKIVINSEIDNGIKFQEYINKTIRYKIEKEHLDLKNIKFNKYSTIINIIIGVLNVALLLWQLSKAE